MQRLKLSPEKKKAEQDKIRFYMKRCCEAESTHKAATRKNNDNTSKKRKCQNESTDAAATRKNNDNASKKRRRQRQQQNFKDRKRINSRVIGYNGLQLPSNIEGEFKKRKFQNWKNTQKCAVTLISVFAVILNLCKRRLFLCLLNKQRTQCYPCSNISEAHTINTPNNNRQ